MIKKEWLKVFVGKVKLNLNVDDGDDRWLIISRVSLYIDILCFFFRECSMPAAVTKLIAPPPHQLYMCFAFRLKILSS